jgi:hypothetical protein
MLQGSWRPAADVAWVVERPGLILIRNGASATRLQHPEAPLWDLVSRGIQGRRLAEMMAAILECEASVAEGYVRHVIEGWVRAGWLARGEARG